MRYLYFLFVCFIALACGHTDSKSGMDNARRDSLAQVAMMDTANYTTIQWLDSVHQNLGKVKEGQVVEISWRVKNTGNRPLVIANVQPGCGCTVAERPEEPIPPGGEGVIKAKFDSNNHPGTQNKDVFVRANNKNKNNAGADLLTFHVEVEKK
jgi:Protein of unknown function (DUF1573)